MPDSRAQGKSQICRRGERTTCLALVKEHALRLGMLGQDAGKEGAIGTSNVYDPAMPIPVVVHHRHMQACSGTGISMPCEQAWRIAWVQQCSTPMIMSWPCWHHRSLPPSHAHVNGKYNLLWATMLVSNLGSRTPLYNAMAL